MKKMLKMKLRVLNMIVGLAIGFVIVAGLVSMDDAQAAKSTNFEAKVYDLKDREKHMFNYKSEVETVGDVTTFENTMTDLEGSILVVEKTVMGSGGNTLVSFEQDQKQLGTVGRLEVVDGKIQFSFTKDGKVKTDSESISDEFIVTSTLVAFVGSHWEKISKGETVKARLGVLDRLETVGFQFKKEKEKTFGEAAGVVVKMKPSSLIISAIVNPLFLGFTADGRRVMEVEGRTSVKVKVDGKFKDFDGLTVYSYPAQPSPEPEKKPAKKK